MYMIPFVLLYVVGYAFLKKRDAYGDFVRGAGEGIHTAFAILPTLVGPVSYTHLTLPTKA